MKINYTKDFLNFASNLDALTDSYCEISKLATNIVEKGDDKDIIILCKKLSELHQEFIKNTKIIAVTKKFYETFVYFIGHHRIEQICKNEIPDDSDSRSLDELLKELNELIGLKEVKEKVQNLITYQRVRKLREENNLKNTISTLHMAFLGNPGTGKTTVARIIGHIYKKIGLLSKGHFNEVSRTDLIAGYQGQTALKVKAVIERAKGGVLFIDEAYSITENDSMDAYGRECLTELTKALEDYRDDLVVIVAGYTKPMESFFKSNPGLKSRFNTFINFEDYNIEELERILFKFCKENDYELEKKLKEKLHSFFESQVAERPENFSNGRFVRNIYDSLVMQQALRIIKILNPSLEDLKTFKVDDFIENFNFGISN